MPLCKAVQGRKRENGCCPRFRPEFQSYKKVRKEVAVDKYEKEKLLRVPSMMQTPPAPLTSEMV